MTNVWVTSDTHFGHENIIKFCSRPFTSAKEMNEAMIENWNSVVGENDIVYHLGDVYFNKNHSDFHNRLKGKKRLILGNHDNAKDPLLIQTFEKIMMWKEFHDFGLILTHTPLHPECFEIDNLGLTNVHGHIHLDKLSDRHYVNVCVEHTNYIPVNIESLRRM